MSRQRQANQRALEPYPDIVPLPPALQLADLEISIDNKNPVFPTSSWINGSIKMTAKKQTTGNETIVVLLEGVTTVAFDSCGVRRYEVSDRADHPLPPMTANKVKTLPFNFYLHPELPSSFHGAHGGTFYHIRAVLQDEENVGRHQALEAFNVITVTDLNPDPAANQPVEATKEDKFGSGTLKQTIAIEHASSQREDSEEE